MTSRLTQMTRNQVTAFDYLPASHYIGNGYFSLSLSSSSLEYACKLYIWYRLKIKLFISQMLSILINSITKIPRKANDSLIMLFAVKHQSLGRIIENTARSKLSSKLNICRIITSAKYLFVFTRLAFCLISTDNSVIKSVSLIKVWKRVYPVNTIANNAIIIDTIRVITSLRRGIVFGCVAIINEIKASNNTNNSTRKELFRSGFK